MTRPPKLESHPKPLELNTAVQRNVDVIAWRHILSLDEWYLTPSLGGTPVSLPITLKSSLLGATHIHSTMDQSPHWDRHLLCSLLWNYLASHWYLLRSFALKLHYITLTHVVLVALKLHCTTLSHVTFVALKLHWTTLTFIVFVALKSYCILLTFVAFALACTFLWL